MIEHLKKFMYVNSIENEKILKIAELIENKNLKPIIFTSKAYMLEYFYDLLNWKLSLEEFYMSLDDFSNIKIKKNFFNNPYDALEFLKFQNINEKEIYIFDDIFDEWFTRKDVSYI